MLIYAFLRLLIRSIILTMICCAIVGVVALVVWGRKLSERENLLLGQTAQLAVGLKTSSVTWVSNTAAVTKRVDFLDWAYDLIQSSKSRTSNFHIEDIFWTDTEKSLILYTDEEKAQKYLSVLLTSRFPVYHQERVHNELVQIRSLQSRRTIAGDFLLQMKYYEKLLKQESLKSEKIPVRIKYYYGRFFSKLSVWLKESRKYLKRKAYFFPRRVAERQLIKVSNYEETVWGVELQPEEIIIEDNHFEVKKDTIDRGGSLYLVGVSKKLDCCLNPIAYYGGERNVSLIGIGFFIASLLFLGFRGRSLLKKVSSPYPFAKFPSSSFDTSEYLDKDKISSSLNQEISSGAQALEYGQSHYPMSEPEPIILKAISLGSVSDSHKTI